MPYATPLLPSSNSLFDGEVQTDENFEKISKFKTPTFPAAAQ